MIAQKWHDVTEEDFGSLLDSSNLGIRLKKFAYTGLGDGSQKLAVTFKHYIIEPGKSYPVHSFKSRVVIFLMAGSVNLTNEQQVFELGTGDVVCLFPHESCLMTNVGSEKLKFICCYGDLL